MIFSFVFFFFFSFLFVYFLTFRFPNLGFIYCFEHSFTSARSASRRERARSESDRAHGVQVMLGRRFPSPSGSGARTVPGGLFPGAGEAWHRRASRGHCLAHFGHRASRRLKFCPSLWSRRRRFAPTDSRGSAARVPLSLARFR